MEELRSREFRAVHKAILDSCGGLLLNDANEPRTEKFMNALWRRGFKVVPLQRRKFKVIPLEDQVDVKT